MYFFEYLIDVFGQEEELAGHDIVLNHDAVIGDAEVSVGEWAGRERAHLGVVEIGVDPHVVTVLVADKVGRTLEAIQKIIN